MTRFQQIKAALDHQSQVIRMIDRNPALSPDDKRQLIDTVYFQMIGTARRRVEGSNKRC